MEAETPPAQMEPAIPAVIDGPVVEAPGHEIIYQITLSSGTVITRPAGFGPQPLQAPLAPAVPTPPQPPMPG
jgi:hypothetical protein